MTTTATTTTTTTDPNRNILWARAIAEELGRSGVRVVAIAPGSRSGPLACALADAAPAEGFRLFVHLDERSAGFFALGAARASGLPSAVVCTSGTAAANLLPAAVEAFFARVPLVLVTADRPPELRGAGANQTVDQARIFGTHVRACAELPVPEPEGRLLRAARATVGRLVGAALGPPAGPVHLNVPFRDPLDPRAIAGDVPADLAVRDPLAFHGRAGAPFVKLEAVAREHGTGSPTVRIRGARGRGLILAGPERTGEPATARIAALARATGYPVLADPCSSVRAGAPAGVTVLATYDAFLRSERFAAAHAPELVIRFGAPPVSKALERYLERHAPRTIIIDDAAGAVDDPLHLGVEILRPEAAMIENVERAADPAFVAAFARADTHARAVLDAASRDAWFEAGIVREIDRALPAGALLFAGNSLPVRELDFFLPACERPLRVLANRGASGIDGVVSSALGAVAASGSARPAVLFIGDLSLLHDATGLLAARRYGLPLAIVVVNNDGGGIFSYLPAREHAGDRFEALFATPHGLDLSALAALHGLPFERPADRGSFESALARAIGRAGPSLIEVRVDRERSAALHRAAWAASVSAVEEI